MKMLGWMLGAVAASALAVGGVIARRLTAPPARRRFELVIRDVEMEPESVVVVVDRNRQTIRRGSYALLFEDGGWAQLADDVTDRGPERVERRVTKLSAGLRPSVGDRASWSGIYFATPAEAGIEAQKVDLPTPVGIAPAWLLEGTGQNASTWAIHIHGMGSPRSGPLRGARVADELGYTSLVLSYRNDGDGPSVGGRRSMLGAAEVDDVAAAVHFAVSRGAQRVVLFGWSMGAAIALQLVLDAAISPHIDALVLESPVLDWVATVKANCVRAGLPAAAGWLAVPWLAFGPLSRAIGLPGPIPFRVLSWMAHAHELETPTLILHGTRDDSTPLQSARALAEIRPDSVHLEEFDAGHTMTWNSDPERWERIVSSWLSTRLPKG
ncbi:Alpha/beta hydrolase family protein [Microbacterium sp. cf046]|uniref:alpha/beta hydrolase n=1 Tax=Microbacterium sp. cf046 TaxID=1761803 RepID=UPI0008E81792|nr:alpha/beta fold hydrolase [Microbacterium sp. cf046]SFS16598.1 Alpha/beta hydrolase family protein [Microbacterium sp. cf046]